jgi:hypothetical protein
MPYWLILVLLCLVGGVLGIFLGRWAGRRLVAPRLQALKLARPVKGTRPHVRLDYDGVTYDLTDDLLRANDRDGKAVWVVQGPLHIRFSVGEVIDLRITHWDPTVTAIAMSLRVRLGKSQRFMTLQELLDEYPELATKPY